MSKFASCLHHPRDPAIGHRHQRTRAATVALSPTAGTASPVRMAPRAVRFTLANPARSFAATAVVLLRYHPLSLQRSRDLCGSTRISFRSP